jgi:hypothetical protein
VVSAKTAGRTPFGAVWKSYTKTTTKYYPAAMIERDWKAWLLRCYH